MSRRRVQTESGFESDLRELVRRPAPREEGGGLGLLLHERHRAGDPGAAEAIPSIAPDIVECTRA